MPSRRGACFSRATQVANHGSSTLRDSAKPAQPCWQQRLPSSTCRVTNSGSTTPNLRDSANPARLCHCPGLAGRLVPSHATLKPPAAAAAAAAHCDWRHGKTDSRQILERSPPKSSAPGRGRVRCVIGRPGSSRGKAINSGYKCPSALRDCFPAFQPVQGTSCKYGFSAVLVPSPASCFFETG